MPVEQGVRIRSRPYAMNLFGNGGRPEGDGHSPWDACIMDDGNCGAVLCMENIAPILFRLRESNGGPTPQCGCWRRSGRQLLYEKGFQKQPI